MCVIAVMDKGKIITQDQYEESICSNRDGVGVLFNGDGLLWSWKSVSDKDSGYEIICKAREKYPDAVIGFHSRFATHGSVNDENCHPFFAHSGAIGMMHNGVFRFRDIPKNFSDSRYFAEEVLDKLPPNFIDNIAILDLLDHFALKSSSKVFILEKTGNYFIAGKNLGHINDEIWWSNHSYKSYTKTSWKGFTPTQKYLPPAKEESKKDRTEYKCQKCSVAGIVHPKMKRVSIKPNSSIDFTIPLCRRCYRWSLIKPLDFQSWVEEDYALSESEKNRLEKDAGDAAASI